MKDDDLEDLRTIRLVLSGDSRAFRSIVDRHGPAIRRYCAAKTGNDDDAFDLAQETLFRAFKSLATFKLGKSFPAWLFTIAANAVRTRIKRAAADRRRIERVAAELAGSDRETRDSTSGESRLVGESVRKAVASLPDEYRVAVELHYFGGLGAAEIGEALGLGEEGVKTRLFRARKMLRALLDPQPGGRQGGTTS
ncbi:MAG: RNA polymerase sigma factor [Spirochaetes bacterium]|nr:RNA polymerase sigma factor [Spirochaetota bacterium]